MAQSYIPAGTDVICTEMLSTLPSQIVTEREAKVLYGKENKALLNICDKKLTCQLKCRIKVSYYEGLGSLLLGLTLGAAAVAFSVITFGAGTAVVAAAVITTGALGGAAIFYSNKADDCRQAPHECDSTKGGTWELFHRKVYIEKANALLERSFLTCQKGGIVSLVMSHEKALELSKKISDSNKKILELNLYSNALQGFIGSGANAFKASGGWDVAGLIISSGLAVYDYVSGADENYRNQNMKNQQEYANKVLKGEKADLEADGSILKPEMGRDAGVSGVLTAGEASVGVIGSNGEVLKTLGRWGAEEVSQGNNVSRAFWRVLAGRTAKNVGKQMVSESIKGLKDKTNLQKLGVGVVASMISNLIELSFNSDANNIYIDMIDEIKDVRIKNKGQLNVYSDR